MLRHVGRIGLILGILTLWVPTAALAQRPAVTVGVVFDGPDGDRALASGILPQIEEATRSLTDREFDVRFPPAKQRVGDWSLNASQSALDELLADPEVDLVLALGPIVSGLACAGRPSKPVIAPWVFDIEAQSLPVARDAEDRPVSGVPNLLYLTVPGDFVADLHRFRDLLGLSRVSILIDRQTLQSIRGLPNFIERARSETGLRLDVVTSGDTAAEVLDALPEGTSAVYVTPLVSMPSAEFADLIEALRRRRLPSFSLSGHDEVRLGILAGLRPERDIPRMARRVSLGIQRILLGEEAGRLPVVVDAELKLMINLLTAVEIGYRPSWDVLFEAELVDDDRIPRGPRLTLQQAVLEAVAGNRELRTADREVAAGEQIPRAARGARRPRLVADLQGLQIDDDRAAASFGSQPERTWTGSFTVDQVVFDDGVNADVTIADRQQEVRVLDRELLRLDIALETSIAFLDLLRARVLERVERDNLDLTESNLELARRRLEIGYSGPADVYRFESELATDRAAVIVANNRTNATRVLVNQLRNRAQEALFEPVPPEVSDLLFVQNVERLDPFVNDPTSFKLFRDFSVAEGLRDSVELRAIDAGIAAQERAERAARREYTLPDLFLQGTISHELDAAGAGQAGAAFEGIPLADETDWSVGLVARLPLWSGGALRAERRRALETLAQLRAQRDSVAQQIELRIRSATFEAGSTYPAIELTRQAADAAQRNLELVTDSYSRGLATVIQLLDAQTAAQAAEAAASNAIYDFLVDLMEIQRATNAFGFFVSADEREAWLQRLTVFFDEHRDERIVPWR